MSRPNDGGAAFPRAPADFEQGQVAQDGMSLRDYFAAAALSASQHLLRNHNIEARDIAAHVYHIADAMIVESERGTK